jgi:hypothetical protein
MTLAYPMPASLAAPRSPAVPARIHAQVEAARELRAQGLPLSRVAEHTGLVEQLVVRYCPRPR